MAKSTKHQIKIKEKGNKKISKEELNSFKPTHIKFNFSFMTTNNGFSFSNSDFTERYKAQLMQRIVDLSNEDYIKLMHKPKNVGLEFIERSSFNRQPNYHLDFDKSEFRRSSSDKFSVFRLYPNNNPIPGRIIGKVVNKIFYVMFIDLDHQMYNG